MTNDRVAAAGMSAQLSRLYLYLYSLFEKRLQSLVIGNSFVIGHSPFVPWPLAFSRANKNAPATAAGAPSWICGEANRHYP